MKKLLMLVLIMTSACSQKTPGDLVLVKGGALKNTTSNYYQKKIPVADFYIGTHEVTQKEWTEIMGSNPSTFKGTDLPVETVNWYDCIMYCNKRSVKEGLMPFYTIDNRKKDPANTDNPDDMKWIVTINEGANGYRLPTEIEWEYAAGGGQASRNYFYSGSKTPDDVAWYWKNSGDEYLDGAWSWPVLEKNNNKTKPVGEKAPNELGLYDMSGNVREWCWDRYTVDSIGISQGRVWKGGGWMGADFCCELSFRAGLEANGKGPDQGLRVCRSAQMTRQ